MTATAPTVAAAPTSAPQLAQAPLPTSISVAVPVATATEVPSTPIPAIPSFAPRALASGEDSGEILNELQRDAYPINAQKGQLLEIYVQPLGGSLIPHVQVLDPRDVDEVRWTIPVTGIGVRKQLATSGPYRIRVKADQGTGPYQISWSLDRFGQLADGGQASSQITVMQPRDAYRFDGQQGQTMRARARRTTGASLRLWMRLVDPDGTEEAMANGSSQPELTLQTKLANTGAYTLVVGGENAGRYQVNLSLT